MQFKRFAKAKPNLSPAIVVPLVNVLFLLLVFFLLSSSWVVPSSVTVKLPQGVTSETIQEENLVIILTAEDVLYLDDKVATMKTLRQELKKKENKDRLILLKASQRASLGRVVDIWNLCRELKIEKINIATDQE